MQLRWIFASVALFAVAASIVTTVELPGAVEAAPPAKSDPHDPEPTVAAHARLARLAGDYTWWSMLRSTDGAPPIESRGEARVASILDGRFIELVEHGDISHPFEARKLWGYNVPAARYEGVWTYSGSTAMSTLIGRSLDGGRTIVFDAAYAVGADASPQHFEVVLEEIDARSFSIRVSHGSGDGAAKGSLKTTYTRRK